MIEKQRAKELVAQMTLDEKIGMIHGDQLFQTKGVERLGIPPLRLMDGPMGVRSEFEPDAWKAVGFSDDYVTYLPCMAALASSWNRELAYCVGDVLGEEARGRGKDVILAPGVNIKRSPLCGRNFEYFSEDPYLTKELAVPYIKGVQNWDVSACVKHFAANNQEMNRFVVGAEIEDAVLREIYFPAFYAAITEGECGAVMGAYTKLRGEFCCQSQTLLSDILRKEWGYEGMVVSDWGGVHDTDAAAKSGLDLEMSVTNDFDHYCMAEPLKEKIRNGEISESLIDEKAEHILMLMMRLHMLDGERKAGRYNTPEHRMTALKAARESVVLLKNEAGRLPLSKKCKRVLLIGDNAESIHSNGGGSAEIKALYEITPLMGVKMLLGGNTEVGFARGYCREEDIVESEMNWQEKSMENGGGVTASVIEVTEELEANRRMLREEALRMAQEYDEVIFVGGLNHNHDVEGQDRASMRLPYGQDQLITELLQIRPDAVIVMMGGSCVDMENWVDKADSLLWYWYSGMEGGLALAETIFGDVNPSGKLPETFYKKLEDCSAHCLGEFGKEDCNAYKEGLFVGYRYNDTFEVEPRFAFGHGLSYTEFQYEEPFVRQEENQWYALCQVSNVGTQAGAEVVQIYLAEKEAKEKRPVQELKGFEKVWLKPGEQVQVKIKIEGYREECEVRFGASSRDIRLQA